MDSLKSHLVELEAERVELEAGIALERMEAPEIEREAVVWFLERFRDADRSDAGWRIFLVETFLQAAWLFDDGRLIVQLNFGGKNSRITVQLAQAAVSEGEVLGSCFAPSDAPSKDNKKDIVPEKPDIIGLFGASEGGFSSVKNVDEKSGLLFADRLEP